METTLASRFRVNLLAGTLLVAGMGRAPSAYGQDSDSRSDISEECSSKGLPGVMDVLEGRRGYSVLITALERTGIDQGLRIYPSYTLLAPTDSAFAELDVPISEMARYEAADMLRNHVVQKALTIRELRSLNKIKNARGRSIRLAHDPERIGGATLLNADIMFENGIVHAIDTVLLMGIATD